jgi:hypothetical protein
MCTQITINGNTWEMELWVTFHFPTDICYMGNERERERFLICNVTRLPDTGPASGQLGYGITISFDNELVLRAYSLVSSLFWLQFNLCQGPSRYPCKSYQAVWLHPHWLFCRWLPPLPTDCSDPSALLRNSLHFGMKEIRRVWPVCLLFFHSSTLNVKKWSGMCNAQRQ